MELPEEIIQLLRDEAYLRLCRAALDTALEQAARDKDCLLYTSRCV